ncbi:hypothetical protein LCGC14_2902550 [marine sediment metagenome]|uniref:Uncharacterized protein n=1 Tax=marine sediment metagenome TaxID=412755 RepID=A0A0F8YFV5_9ZZZZ
MPKLIRTIRDVFERANHEGHFIKVVTRTGEVFGDIVNEAAYVFQLNRDMCTLALYNVRRLSPSQPPRDRVHVAYDAIESVREYDSLPS